MTTEIVNDWPPNIKAIRAVLPVSAGNIFAYGGKIYNPGCAELTPELLAHEAVHFRQQGKFPGRWWKKFLRRPEFRLEQELEAHREEYRVFCQLHRDRNAKARFLRQISLRLAAPMYGGIITLREAMVRIAK